MSLDDDAGSGEVVSARDQQGGEDVNGENEDVSSSSSEGEDDDEENKADCASLVMGGTIASPAFALLVGMFEDPKEGTKRNISLPLTRLPAKLGRTHKTDETNFFGLGSAKALSRNHCVIFYRDAVGGRLGQFDGDGDEELTYQPRKREHRDRGDDADEIIQHDHECEASLPEHGFFAIECLGKNKIIVGGKRVDMNQVALLRHGTTIKLGSYSLYFLLPSDCSSDNKETMMKVPNPAYEEYQRKRALERAPVVDDDDDNSSISSSKKQRSVPPQGVGAELEALPLETLLDRITEACKSDQWDRKNQMLGTAVAMHAVRDAAQSSELQSIAKEHGGVARGEVLDWIEKSPLYSNWVSQMLSKLEEKSYHSNISKAIIRSGYQRTGTTGRHVRWALPKDVLPRREGRKEGLSDEMNRLSAERLSDDTNPGKREHERASAPSIPKKTNISKSGKRTKKKKNTSKHAKKKQAGRAKDPDAPKRPKTPFLYFSNANRPKLQEQNPGVSFADLGRLVGKAWEGISASEKEKCEALSNADKARYKIEMEAYEKKRSEMSSEESDSDEGSSADNDSDESDDASSNQDGSSSDDSDED
uniref:HMG box domain-containing protein n=1 Tax=Odontella aurita TaxID=265563 RepID=A0A7S4IX46_9STRA|mmetsp:Transcript_31903/g.95515  ORF Transcript_31903/g.95515 Transcript_31903/m.95515 type:complete len:590 (+) Transcript_31903:175-1944(+)